MPLLAKYSLRATWRLLGKNHWDGSLKTGTVMSSVPGKAGQFERGRSVRWKKLLH